MFARGAVAAAVADRPFVQAMLDVEAAAARACAAVGLTPGAAAAAIAEAADADRFDLAALAAETARHATPVIGLVAALRVLVGPDAAPHVHRGLTSQDVVDSAAMILAHRALGLLSDDAAGAAEAAARLAAAHRDTPIAGRTLLQHALPTTFGLKAAGWMTGLDEALGDLAAVRDGVLAVQLGGAAGTLAAFGAHGAAVTAAVAADLGLAEPVLPWHAIRRRPAVLAGALGTLAGVLAKIARDVTLLAQTEVGEVREGGADLGRGGSSAMAHKRNPVAAVSAAACAARVPGLVATMLSVMDQEHERAAGGWQAEWETQRSLLTLTGSAAAWVRELLDDLEVDAARMGATAEAAVGALGDGGPQALADGVSAAAALVDRALAAHAAAHARPPRPGGPA
ncbi:MAG: 3-carboxy-cis,cis-muconate cycloisomerase [Baekduia sp.]|nr:3-carboxy-cis,cis-muconate cycloisomerase [Baekduia sp.]